MQSNMLRIDLLRHGETTLSHTLRGSIDDALTENGWWQMQHTIQQHVAAVQVNADVQAMDSPQQWIEWQAIFSSPLQRCADFAQHLADQFRLNLIVDAHLQEMDFGDWEGRPTADIYAESPELLAQFWQSPMQYCAPNGETMQHFHARIIQAFEAIQRYMQVHDLNHVLVVSHGGVIKLLKCLALQQPLNQLLSMQAEHGQLSCFELINANEDDDNAHLQFKCLGPTGTELC